MGFKEDQERRRLENALMGLFSENTTVRDRFQIGNIPVSIGIGYISTNDLEDLGVPLDQKEIDYIGTPCYVLVESEGRPVKAVLLMQEHLDKAKTLQNGGDRWQARLKVGIELLLSQNIIQEVKQGS